MISVSRTNESFERLKQKFRQADESQLPWTEILRLFYEDEYFRKRLERCSARAIKRHNMPRHLEQDVAQEALVLFAKSLERNRSLGFDHDNGDFGGFVNLLLNRFCSNGLRQFKKQNARSLNEINWQPSYCQKTRLDEQLDLQDAIDQMPPPYCTVVQRLFEGRTIAEISTEMDRSQRTIYRWIDRAVDHLQKLRD